HALESAIVQRMVLRLHGEALVGRVEARSLRHGPALEHALELEPEVVMQARGGVALDVIAQPAFLRCDTAAARLGRDREIAHRAVAFQPLGHGSGYSKARARPVIATGENESLTGEFADGARTPAMCSRSSSGSVPGSPLAWSVQFSSDERRFMGPAIALRLRQHLTLTPQVQQALKLLQMSALEFAQEMEQALAANPFLEDTGSGAPATPGESREEPREA